jgi:dTDP-4-amino-4,6-dideoxygalactose transaminase
MFWLESLDISERLAQEILSLPMFPGMTEQQQRRVVEAIKDFKKGTIM